METLEGIAQVTLGIVILSGIPVVLLFVLAYWLRGYRWARTAWITARGLALFEPTMEERQEAAKERIHQAHCWQMKHCAMAKRVHCPAYARSYLPCWLAVQLAGNEQKHDCANCALYDLRKAAA